tara:strand:+ start:457 stop:1272 length:816 start_codon:yes stop_codon:yes gene_type:complete
VNLPKEAFRKSFTKNKLLEGSFTKNNLWLFYKMSIVKKLYDETEIIADVDEIPMRMAEWQEHCFGPNTSSDGIYLKDSSQYIRDLAGDILPITEGFGVVTYLNESGKPQKVASGTLQKKTDGKWFANEICSVKFGNKKPPKSLVADLFSLFEDKVISDGQKKIYLEVDIQSKLKPGSALDERVKDPTDSFTLAHAQNAAADFLLNYYAKLNFEVIDTTDHSYIMMKKIKKGKKKKGGRKTRNKRSKHGTNKKRKFKKLNKFRKSRKSRKSL